ncbi:MAG: hypothetical protein EOP84_15645, partial [Verrucomicrobiaceae bacterium]
KRTLTSNNTVRLELALLGHLYSTAIKEWGLGLTFNPVASVRKPKPGKGRERRFVGDEEDRLLGAINAHSNPMLGWIARIAVETSMRKSEIAELTLSQVDLIKRVVHLPDTKNNDFRTVPLNKRATDAMQSAVLNVKLPHLDTWSAGRRERAAFYRKEFARYGLDGVLRLPHEPWAGNGLENHHIYNQFVLRAPQREALRKHLQAHNIGTEVYYPLPLHLQECFKYLGYFEGDFPESERAAHESLALPIYPELTEEEQRYVVEKIVEFYAK